MMAAVEAEFGESLADTIVGLREMGNSWRTVAGALEIGLTTLREWRRLLGLPLAQHDNVHDPSSCPEYRPSDLKAQALGYRDMADACRDLRLRHGLTIEQIGRLLGLHPGTVSNRSPPEVRGTCNLSTEGRAIRAANLQRNRNPKPRRDHPWRQDEDARRDKIRYAERS